MRMDIRRLRRMPLVSPRLWRRRLVAWAGALLVALAAILFALAADGVHDLFAALVGPRPWLIFLLAPAGLALSAALTRHVFPGAQGSGIPQVIAALHMQDGALVNRVLAVRIGLGKVVLTLLGLLAGGSIGREGPTVQVGATIMHALGRRLALPRPELQRGLILAGGAAGVAAAFNTPLAGVVFAIEELSHSFDARTTGSTLIAVIIAGIASIALMGNYSYFGVSEAQLALGAGWAAVAVAGVAGGLLGGAFSGSLVWAAGGIPGLAGRLVGRYPVGFAALCGLALAVIGWASGGTTYGTGYAEARSLVEGGAELPAAFALLKFLATLVSYLSGIPGGIFAPSLSIGAGLGQWLSVLMPFAPAGAVVLLGMVGYFAGVVQAPITAAVIVMEMTSNHAMMIPLMATSMLAYGVSRLVCRRPLYGALARRFLMAQERGRGRMKGEE